MDQGLDLRWSKQRALVLAFIQACPSVFSLSYTITHVCTPCTHTQVSVRTQITPARVLQKQLPALHSSKWRDSTMPPAQSPDVYRSPKFPHAGFFVVKITSISSVTGAFPRKSDFLRKRYNLQGATNLKHQLQSSQELGLPAEQSPILPSQPRSTVVSAISLTVFFLFSSRKLLRHKTRSGFEPNSDLATARPN